MSCQQFTSYSEESNKLNTFSGRSSLRITRKGIEQPPIKQKKKIIENKIINCINLSNPNFCITTYINVFAFFQHIYCRDGQFM